MTLLLLYGSLDDSPKSTGVHAFMAPEHEFICAGGWVAAAAYFLDLDAKHHIGDLVKQGLLPATSQVKIFAQLSDLWIQEIFYLYIQQMQANVKALHNLRIAALAAWDTNAIIIHGADGYNDIEYRH